MAGRRRDDQGEELPLAEAARIRGLSRFTLASAARTGRLRARPMGSQWVTTLAAVDTWLKEARHRPGPAPRPRVAEAPAQYQIPSDEDEQVKAPAA
jgi:hypothetical protein